MYISDYIPSTYQCIYIVRHESTKIQEPARVSDEETDMEMFHMYTEGHANLPELAASTPPADHLEARTIECSGGARTDEETL